MKHHIIVKFTDSTDKKTVIAQAISIFNQAKSIKGIHAVNAYTNCIDRPNRYDLMIVIDMDKEALSAYDESEPHKKWKSEYACYIQSKAIFDCE